MSQSVVITGMGVVSSIGIGEADFWNSLLVGRSGASPVTGFDTADLPRSIACQVRANVPADPNTGRAAAMAIQAARQAVDQSDISNNARVAVIVGTTMGETMFIENRLAAPGEQWLSADHTVEIAQGQPGSISRHVQRAIGVSGTAIDLYGACAAGNMAIAAACRMLRNDECDVVVCGGADGFSVLAFVGFMRARVMAAGTCRPFDESRDGLLVGEGAGMLVLERESDALARGARVRARVLGTAMTCESYHPTRPDPDGDGLCRATLAALKSADLSERDVDFVCAHGTGTPHNDAIEIKVLTHCFPAGVPFSSIKALTGHPMGAAAALEAIACVLSLEHQTLIPTWNLTTPAPSENCEALRGSPRPARLRHVLNNSAGFGGYNSSVLLGVA